MGPEASLFSTKLGGSGAQGLEEMHGIGSLWYAACTSDMGGVKLSLHTDTFPDSDSVAADEAGKDSNSGRGSAAEDSGAQASYSQHGMLLGKLRP